eukprot:TRINITY_DN7019_c0_g1_i1.p1 TRINITY_DN7019_c0_g1~~TRINITY_DN7019_c0_g1_i1.p1  ORF type:complete len:1141 (-),score=218.16 TRINITY_DN7019_c0_g1_i1:128-3550(-)
MWKGTLFVVLVIAFNVCGGVAQTCFCTNITDVSSCSRQFGCATCRNGLCDLSGQCVSQPYSYCGGSLDQGERLTRQCDCLLPRNETLAGPCNTGNNVSIEAVVATYCSSFTNSMIACLNASSTCEWQAPLCVQKDLYAAPISGCRRMQLRDNRIFNDQYANFLSLVPPGTLRASEADVRLNTYFDVRGNCLNMGTTNSELVQPFVQAMNGSYSSESGLLGNAVLVTACVGGALGVILVAFVIASEVIHPEASLRGSISKMMQHADYGTDVVKKAPQVGQRLKEPRTAIGGFSSIVIICIAVMYTVYSGLTYGGTDNLTVWSFEQKQSQWNFFATKQLHFTMWALLDGVECSEIVEFGVPKSQVYTCDISTQGSLWSCGASFSPKCLVVWRSPVTAPETKYNMRMSFSGAMPSDILLHGEGAVVPLQVKTWPPASCSLDVISPHYFFPQYKDSIDKFVFGPGSVSCADNGCWKSNFVGATNASRVMHMDMTIHARCAWDRPSTDCKSYAAMFDGNMEQWVVDGTGDFVSLSVSVNPMLKQHAVNAPTLISLFLELIGFYGSMIGFQAALRAAFLFVGRYEAIKTFMLAPILFLPLLVPCGVFTHARRHGVFMGVAFMLMLMFVVLAIPYNDTASWPNQQQFISIQTATLMYATMAVLLATLYYHLHPNKKEEPDVREGDTLDKAGSFFFSLIPIAGLVWLLASAHRRRRTLRGEFGALYGVCVSFIILFIIIMLLTLYQPWNYQLDTSIVSELRLIAVLTPVVCWGWSILMLATIACDIVKQRARPVGSIGHSILGFLIGLFPLPFGFGFIPFLLSRRKNVPLRLLMGAFVAATIIPIGFPVLTWQISRGNQSFISGFQTGQFAGYVPAQLLLVFGFAIMRMAKLEDCELGHCAAFFPGIFAGLIPFTTIFGGGSAMYQAGHMFGSVLSTIGFTQLVIPLAQRQPQMYWNFLGHAMTCISVCYGFGLVGLTFGVAKRVRKSSMSDFEMVKVQPTMSPSSGDSAEPLGKSDSMILHDLTEATLAEKRVQSATMTAVPFLAQHNRDVTYPFPDKTTSAPRRSVFDLGTEAMLLSSVGSNVPQEATLTPPGEIESLEEDTNIVSVADNSAVGAATDDEDRLSRQSRRSAAQVAVIMHNDVPTQH